MCKDKLSSCALCCLRTVSTSHPACLFSTWLRLWVSISIVSNWKTSERSSQVRRDALCSVGNPDCNKVRANEDDKCLD